MLSVPKLADMVHAQDFFKCNRRKLILQMTVPTVTKISHVTSIESELQSDYERSWLIVGLWECMPISCVSCALWARSLEASLTIPESWASVRARLLISGSAPTPYQLNSGSAKLRLGQTLAGLLL